MVLSFKHKGLARFFETGSKSGVQSRHAERLRLILGRLNAAAQPKDMVLPGLRLHPLKGSRKCTRAVWISGNWRVTFPFIGGVVDLLMAFNDKDHGGGTLRCGADSPHRIPFDVSVTQ